MNSPGYRKGIPKLQVLIPTMHSLLLILFVASEGVLHSLPEAAEYISQCSKSLAKRVETYSDDDPAWRRLWAAPCLPNPLRVLICDSAYSIGDVVKAYLNSWSLLILRRCLEPVPSQRGRFKDFSVVLRQLAVCFRPVLVSPNYMALYF